MKRLAVIIATALTLSACGSATKPNSQESAAVTKAKAELLQCSSNGAKLLTHAGRVSTLHCVDPSGKNQQALTQCATKAIASGHPFTPSGRRKVEDAVAQCVVTNR